MFLGKKTYFNYFDKDEFSLTFFFVVAVVKMTQECSHFPPEVGSTNKSCSNLNNVTEILLLCLTF